MRPCLFLILLFACLGAYAIPYPISARPLRLLVKESQVIVEAYVFRVEPVQGALAEQLPESSYLRSGGQAAHLLVKSVWQGKVQSDTVTVYFNPNLICPEPDRYFAGTTVLAFLDNLPGTHAFLTHALSYGSKTLLPEAMELYKARIKEIQGILQVKDATEQRKQTLDWLVACAANPLTRQEGTLELMPYSDFMLDTLKGAPAPAPNSLSQTHQATLFNALLQQDNLSNSDMLLLDLTSGYNDDQLLTWMIKQLRSQGDSWVAVGLMKKIGRLKKNARLEQLAQEYSHLYSSYYLNTQLPDRPYERLRKDFIAQL